MLARVRAAYGWEALAAGDAGWQIRGSCVDQGMEGSFHHVFQPDGRFAVERSTELGFAGGFDGEVAWLRDASGVTRVLRLGSRDRALGATWIDEGLWLDPEGERMEVELEEESPLDGTVALRVSLPDRPWSALVLVDPETWLPGTVLEERPAGVQRTELSDWRAPRGFQVAHRTEVTGVGGEVSVYEVESVTPAPAFLRSPFEPVFEWPADTTFAAGSEGGVEIDVRAAPTGHVLVHPRVDGEDVGWFLLDSAAGMNCIDPEVADRLGWPEFGEVSVVGGGGATLASFRRGKELALGPVRIERPAWLELDLTPLEPVFGVEVGGIIGYDLFARAVVVMELAEPRVWLHDPRDREPPAGAVELALDDTSPCVECAFAGPHAGWFRLDTGSDDTVTFHGPAVERLDLRPGEDAQRVELHGVGGFVRGFRQPIAWFELGGHRLEDLDVTFLESSAGGLNDPLLVGNVGWGLLRRFRVSFDYWREKAWVAPLD